MGSLTVRYKSTPVLPCYMGQGLGQVTRVSDKIYQVPNSRLCLVVTWPEPRCAGAGPEPPAVSSRGPDAGQWLLSSSPDGRLWPGSQIFPVTQESHDSSFWVPIWKPNKNTSLPASLLPAAQAQPEHALCSHAKVTPAQSTDKLLTFPQAWVAASRTDCLAASFEHY